MHNNEYYSFSFYYAKSSAWHIIRRSILFGGRTETWTQTSEYPDYSQFSKLLPYQLDNMKWPLLQNVDYSAKIKVYETQ